MNYYQVKVYYKRGEPRVSAHIVKAKNKQEAIQITERYGIANPFHSESIDHRQYLQLDMRLKQCKDIIKRRHQGIGGSVWFEENGKLQKETK